METLRLANVFLETKENVFVFVLHPSMWLISGNPSHAHKNRGFALLDMAPDSICLLGLLAGLVLWPVLEEAVKHWALLAALPLPSVLSVSFCVLWNSVAKHVTTCVPGGGNSRGVSVTWPHFLPKWVGKVHLLFCVTYTSFPSLTLSRAASSTSDLHLLGILNQAVSLIGRADAGLLPSLLIYLSEAELHLLINH